jgi:DNA-binding CsgD family transcriptional regulator
MDDKAVQVLSAKLDAIIKLMMFAMTEGKSQTEQVRLLSAAGFQPKEIAHTLGTTPNTVSVALSNLRKRKDKGTNRKGEVQA